MNTTARSPLLSVVTASRNDDHGGNPLARMQLFIDGLADQAGRFRFHIELVVVEWNPPADRPPLEKVLSWHPSEHFSTRIITVPNRIHQTYPHADGLPLFQMIAKNVGIRRAKAPYVLATNIDILLSDELFAYLSTDLKPHAMYRVDRRDVNVVFDQQQPPTPAEVRRLPALRQHSRDGTRFPGGPAPRRLRPRRSLIDLPRLARAAVDRAVLPRLHTNGAGDFTLTSREVWASIHGYAEWPFYSFYIDGLPLFQAYAGGVDVINLDDPMVAIHLEHSTGSGWTPEGAGALFGRLDKAGVPYLSSDEYRSRVRTMVLSRRGFQPINGGDWGLGSVELETSVP